MEVPFENSVRKWDKVSIIVMTFCTFFFAVLGFVYLFQVFLYPVEVIPATYTTIILFLTGGYSLIPIFRNSIIEEVFLRVNPLKISKFSQIVTKIFTLSFFMFVVTPFLVFVFPELDVSRLSALVFSFLFLYIPFLFLAVPITTKGELRIVFENLFLNFNNFNKRQKWLKKIFDTLEKKLKKGKVKISSNKLIYHCNLKLMDSEDIKKELRTIEQWMLEEKTEKLVTSIKKIIPEEEIKPIKKTSILDRFFQIPEDVRKYLILAIIIIVLILWKPELIEKIITEIVT